MKRISNIKYSSLVICFILVMAIAPTPVAHAEWTVIGIFEVKNSDNFQSARFSIPDNAEKIRLTFEVTIDNPSGKYALIGSILNEENEKWEIKETEGLTHVMEFDDITGTINLSLLLTLAHATLTVEWYVQDSIPTPEPSPEPEPDHSGWTDVNVFEVKNMDGFQSARFSIPDNAEKIRLTFEIIIDNPSGKYTLYGTLLNEENEKWEFQENQGFTHVMEYNDVTGTINLSLLLTLAHGTLTVEWYVSEPKTLVEADFPSDFRSIEYVQKHRVLGEVYDYIIYEYLEYGIININIAEGYFDYTLTRTYEIIKENGIEINGFKLYYEDTMVEEHPFSKNQNYQVSVSRRVNIEEGIILSTLSDSPTIDTAVITYGEGEQREVVFEYYRTDNYIPMAWKWYYEDVSDYDNIIDYSEDGSVYECYETIYSEDDDHGINYIMVDAGVYLYSKSVTHIDIENSYLKVSLVNELTEIVYWNNVEDVEISFHKEAPELSFSVQKNSISAGESQLVIGNINPVPEDDITIILTSPVTFSGSEIKRKLMITTTADQNGDFNINLNLMNDVGTWYIQAIYEGNLYMNEIKSPNLSFQVVNPETNASEDKSTANGGIPSFPSGSILLGIAVGLILYSRIFVSRRHVSIGYRGMS